VIAVYRISHDRWENREALSEAKSFGMSFFERAMQKYVTDYKPANTVAAAGTVASPLADTHAVSR
jgi:hypothetical protein